MTEKLKETNVVKITDKPPPEISEPKVEIKSSIETFGKAILMKPGTWNSITYTPEEIRKCWIKLPKELLVFEEFQETVDHFVGKAGNFVIEKETGILVCDIVLWKKYPDIKYIMVMPNISGDITRDRVMINFTIDNISLVMNPLLGSQKRMEVSIVR